jgi:hypothetical protein
MDVSLTDRSLTLRSQPLARMWRRCWRLRTGPNHMFRSVENRTFFPHPPQTPKPLRTSPWMEIDAP